MTRILFFFFISISMVSFSHEKTNPKNQSEELGKVEWYRNYEEALVLSRTSKKPILILFQEIPGCSTCRNYGHNVLTHPLMIEAIDNFFIPLAIYNNKGGADKKILDKYGEPSWNNPVVRFVNSAGKDEGGRISGDYAAFTLANGMKKQLIKDGKAVPTFLNLLLLELSNKNSEHIETGYFKMFCYWSGEKIIGQLPGVLTTEAGHGGGEIVKFTYDARLVSEEKLKRFGEKHDLKWIRKPSNYSKSTTDDKYYLRNSDYQFIPMSEIQRTKINSAIGKGEDPRLFLSPSQEKWLVDVQKGVLKKEMRYRLPFTKTYEALRY